MKRGLFHIISIAFSALLIFCLAIFLPINKYSGHEPFAKFRTNGKSFEIYEEGSYKPFRMVGVNLGSGYPGLFPNELGIKGNVYYNWFDEISKMNANVIRVYQLQSPEFYSSLAKYNKKHDKKLYLVQSIELSDDLMYTEKNIFSSEIKNELYKQSKGAVNAVHGDYMRINSKKHSLDIYWSDVSQYVIGYCLGVEWDELFVKYVNELNSNIISYNGEYFRCDTNATPFEIFLADWAETVVSHEEKKYNEHKLISICNWAETDPLVNEINIAQDLMLNKGDVGADRVQAAENIEVFVDSDRVVPTPKLKSGVFASYNVYPYYPIFLQFGKYTKYVDSTGKRNPYVSYLKELNEHHKNPVVITEYGIPSSRTITHEDIWRGFSHGGLNEKQQGEVLVKLFNDINEAGCAGSFVFTWQDEWYKRAWNEMLLSNPNGRAFWSNEQCVEQMFGILAFEPEKEGETPYPDGDLSEWKEKDVISKTSDLCLSMKSNEKYVYFMVKGIDKRKGNNLINISIDTTPKTGVSEQENRRYSRNIDFIIKVSDNKKGYLYVDNKYDTLTFSMYNKLQPGINVDKMKEIYRDYSENIIPMYEGSDFNLVSRASGSIIAVLNSRFNIVRAGELKFGNTNPKSKDFISNADFYVKDDAIEIRIPWQLLNFCNPPKREIIDDLNKNNGSIKALKINSIYACAYYDDETQIDDFGKLKLKSWNKPKFHERKKQSYYILQKAFGGEIS